MSVMPESFFHLHASAHISGVNNMVDDCGGTFCCCSMDDICQHVREAITEICLPDRRRRGSVVGRGSFLNTYGGVNATRREWPSRPESGSGEEQDRRG